MPIGPYGQYNVCALCGNVIWPSDKFDGVWCSPESDVNDHCPVGNHSPWHEGEPAYPEPPMPVRSARNGFSR